MSASPRYRVDRDHLRVDAQSPVSDADWDAIIDVARERQITGLTAACITDYAIERISQIDSIIRLKFDGARLLTDAGALHLAKMPQLLELDLSGYHSVLTDAGLAALSQLPNLRRFQMCWPQRVTDAGIANLKSCDQLECVNLLGTPTGDGAIAALQGKTALRDFRSGSGVTDAGFDLLHDFPVFKEWQSGAERIELMSFDAEPNYLLLRGPITDAGIAKLTRLEGLFALNLDDRSMAVNSAGLNALVDLPHLAWLGFDATDESMPAIAALPRLRFLMCQDTVAGDVGFNSLSASKTLEYIWGRRCHNLKDVGFEALATMPALRGLSVSCKNVSDAALTLLPRFPVLREFMPMDVPDAGFRHVGECTNLEALWCMYCRDTTDAATEHLTALSNLRSYYAGYSQITDRSLEILSWLNRLERLTFEGCQGITDAGIRHLAALPLLKEVDVGGSPQVTEQALRLFPDSVHTKYST